MGITDGNKKVMDRQVYAADQVIFREGKPGSAAFVVQEGRVEIFKTMNGNEEVILGTIEAGGFSVNWHWWTTSRGWHRRGRVNARS